MIANEHTFTIDTSIDRVWDYVEDIRGWASIFPGYQDCSLINDNDSEWTIKVSAAGVTRTDNVKVHVEQWNGPERVDFVFDVDDLPVEGNGTYTASACGTNQTEVTLKVCIIGSGPMAPMWEAVGTPLLPEFVKGFAAKLKAEIEYVTGVGTVSAAETAFALPVIKGVIRSTVAALTLWIKGLLGFAPKHIEKEKEGTS
ncbi:MAG: SRPBCC family protein [Pseudomonadota bacterium]|nr:hypothetical protein [Pseudomonadales bacterium]MEC8810471.1 SRPBCC family protein [Pseudomonadota bacterium]|tara:strand:- start:4570 stop:5166 length:597 start_codon:yes stop_codon:yes gene_type:complete